MGKYFFFFLKYLFSLFLFPSPSLFPPLLYPIYSPPPFVQNIPQRKGKKGKGKGRGKGRKKGRGKKKRNKESLEKSSLSPTSGEVESATNCSLLI